MDPLKKKKYSWIIGISIFVLFIMSVAIFPDNKAHNVFSNYLSIFFSWPFTVLVISIIIVFIFRQAIEYKIRQGFIVRKGNTEWDLRQQQADSSSLPNKDVDEIREVLKEIKTTVGSQLETERIQKEAILEFAVFERLIRTLYRSQYLLLTYLKSFGPWPVAHIYLINYKEQYLKRFNGNPDYNFDSYKNYLIHVQNLINEVDVQGIRSFQLTDRGKRFLDYCGSMKYSELEFKPL